jgi:hypothetical protein
MKQFEAVFRSAMQQRKAISIHTDKSDRSSVDCGIIDCFDDDHVRIQAYTSYGFPDGICVLLRQNIFLVDTDGPYEQRIMYLAASLPEQPPRAAFPPILSGSILAETLAQASAGKILVTLWQQDENYSLRGFLQDIDGQVVTLAMCDGHGAHEGIASLALDEISRVGFGSMISQRIQHLAEHQQEFLEFRKQQIR